MTALPSSAISFGGEVHPLASVWPLLAGDELQALADDIAENGLESPITLDMFGRLVDGRNRLAGCELAGVAPEFWVDPDLDAEPRIARYINTVNAERRHLTAGQQAMGRALMLQAQGKRRNGRWERGALFQESGIADSSTYEALKKAGLVLDVAARAAALGQGFEAEAGFPGDVMAGVVRLDFAYKTAQQFDGRAAMAEAMKIQPLNEALTRLEVILDDALALFPLPDQVVPVNKNQRTQVESAKKKAADLGALIRNYMKESRL